jgi:hypothetical protein
MECINMFKSTEGSFVKHAHHKRALHLIIEHFAYLLTE